MPCFSWDVLDLVTITFSNCDSCVSINSTWAKISHTDQDTSRGTWSIFWLKNLSNDQGNTWLKETNYKQDMLHVGSFPYNWISSVTK